MENEITGIYPIIFDGIKAGELTVAREGLFWIFDAKCEMRDEVVRLSVFGNDGEGYLGVMEPNGPVLTLKKKLSRSSLASFPKTITHCGRKGESGLDESGSSAISENVQGEENYPLIHNSEENNAESFPPDENRPPPARQISPPVRFDELTWMPCPCPCSLFCGIEEKSICGYITGAFAAFEGERVFLAVPESVTAEFPSNNIIHFLYEIEILDEIYKVCIIEEGKSIAEH